MRNGRSISANSAHISTSAENKVLRNYECQSISASSDNKPQSRRAMSLRRSSGTRKPVDDADVGVAARLFSNLWTRPLPTMPLPPHRPSAPPTAPTDGLLPDYFLAHDELTLKGAEEDTRANGVFDHVLFPDLVVKRDERGGLGVFFVGGTPIKADDPICMFTGVWVTETYADQERDDGGLRENKTSGVLDSYSANAHFVATSRTLKDRLNKKNKVAMNVKSDRGTMYQMIVVPRLSSREPADPGVLTSKLNVQYDAGPGRPLVDVGALINCGDSKSDANCEVRKALVRVPRHTGPLHLALVVVAKYNLVPGNQLKTWYGYSVESEPKDITGEEATRVAEGRGVSYRNNNSEKLHSYRTLQAYFEVQTNRPNSQRRKRAAEEPTPVYERRIDNESMWAMEQLGNAFAKAWSKRYGRTSENFDTELKEALGPRVEQRVTTAIHSEKLDDRIWTTYHMAKAYKEIYNIEAGNENLLAFVSVKAKVDELISTGKMPAPMRNFYGSEMDYAGKALRNEDGEENVVKQHVLFIDDDTAKEQRGLNLYGRVHTSDDLYDAANQGAGGGGGGGGSAGPSSSSARPSTAADGEEGGEDEERSEEYEGEGEDEGEFDDMDLVNAVRRADAGSLVDKMDLEMVNDLRENVAPG